MNKKFTSDILFAMESTQVEPIIYDKAKWHFHSVTPDTDKAYTHTGMFLGWIVDHDLYSEMFKKESTQVIDDFKNRKIKGTDMYKSWDGVLADDMLNDEGNRFAQFYFDFEKGAFIADYMNVFTVQDPEVFTVADTWENYEKLKQIIDTRFADWKSNA